MNMDKSTDIFKDWEETFIWSCLQGYMGNIVVDNEENPTAGKIEVGDFCLLAGKPNKLLVQKISAPIIIPQTESWELVIEEVWGECVRKTLRYAIKKETNIFDRNKLSKLVDSLEKDYVVQLIDRELYQQAISEEWSKDLCSQFLDYDEYKERGMGVGILHDGRLVAGASSYTIYRGGIEIEIDTKEEYRRKGLATVSGAKLILECLDKGLYPSWDAHDLCSVALAEKLGYHMDKPYVTYVKM